MRQERIVKVDLPDTKVPRQRNCIAVREIKIRPAKKTFAAQRKLDRKLTASPSYAVKNGRLKKCITLSYLRERIGYELKAFYEDVNKKLFYGTCTAMAAMMFTMVFQVNFCFAYSAIIDDTQVGVVPSKAFVEQAIDEVNTEFRPYLSGEAVVEEPPVLLPTIIRKDAYTDPDEFKESVKSTSDMMMQAYAISADGNAVVALSNQEEAYRALNDYLNQFQLDNPDAELYTRQQVEVVNKYVPKTLLKSIDAAVLDLGGTRVKTAEEAITEGETLEAVLERCAMTQERFFALNPDLTEDLTGVTSVVVEYTAPLIEVVTSETVTRDDTIPFETETYEDGSLYEGTSRIVNEGVEGTMQIVEKVIRVNGAVTNTDVLNQTMTSKPVTQTVMVGTKERPPSMGTGSFIRPYYGSISSRFGPRWRGHHTGVDFCGSVGDPIKAADNGVVTYSGWSGGYGKLIKIDHQNGYVTYYAHCSSLIADVGDVVAKGDVIAKVGNTGNSTGPHVHFEIRKNGEAQNPMNYVN